MKTQLVPLPCTVEERDGAFRLDPGAAIGFEGPASAREIAELLAECLRPATGFALPVREGAGAITLAQSAPDPEPDDAGFLPESYALDVAPGGVRLEAATSWGLARGVQTLRQLLPAEIYASEARPGIAWEAPAVRIGDEPECRWRGLMLDSSRHFWSTDDVCRFVELLAQHRMNVFHWHLTDDQGWRVEIRKYPRLAEVGSVRAETLVGKLGAWPHRFDGTPYGGYYTQDDIRRVVAFAARRRVVVVPEIDMPGHMCAAIAAYPELGDGDWARPAVRTIWGISQHVLNMEESTLAFCKDVWTEIMELFPSRFLHIGGDEAPRHEWEESRRAQELMAERGLKKPEQLQAWFTKQLDAFFRSRGRRLLGWDEILEGGVDPSAAIACWRTGWKGWGYVDDTVRAGHDVVLAPTSFAYFDYYQDEPVAEEPPAIGGMLPLSKVYSFSPRLTAVPPEAARRVLGAQGQLWTEYIATRDHLDYMAYPRACALAEVLWTPPERRRYAEFLDRLAAQRARFAVQGVKARPRP